MSNVWDPPEIFWAPSEAWGASLAPPSAAYTAWFEALAPLHCCCCSVLGVIPSLVQASPKCFGLLLQLGFTSVDSPGLFRDSSPTSQYQASATLHGSCFQNQYHVVTLIPPSLTASIWYNLGYLWNTASDSQKTLLRRFHLSDAGFLITANFSASVDQYQWSQQRKGFTWVVLVSC